jgi:hypothetical protein
MITDKETIEFVNRINFYLAELSIGAKEQGFTDDESLLCLYIIADDIIKEELRIINDDFDLRTNCGKLPKKAEGKGK